MKPPTDYTPAEARGLFDESMLTDPNWCAEPKYDGHRATIVTGADGRAEIFTRTGKPIGDRLPQLTGCYADLALSILDGEIVSAGGERSGDVTRIVGSAPDRAIRLQSQGCWMRFVAFGLPRLHGADRRALPESVARAGLVATWCASLDGHPFMRLAPRAESTDDKLALARAELEHREGIMLKRLDAPAGGSGWVKHKRRVTFDCVVLGANPATPGTIWADDGLVGSIRLGQWRNGELEHVADCSGFPMDTRREISANPDAYAGRVVEIIGQDRTASGRILHPRFIRWRTDKPAAECIGEGGGA